MKKPGYFRPGDRQLSARSLNSLVENQRRGKTVAAGAGMAKKVVHGMQVLGLRPREARQYLPFAVWQSAPAKIKVQAGIWYANSTPITYAGAELSVSDGADQFVLATLTVEGTVGVAVALASALPSWSTTTRWRVLAMVSAASGAISTVSPRWSGGDLYTDDVLPRAASNYRVPIMDYTAWGSPALVGGKGMRADIVRMTEGDPE